MGSENSPEGEYHPRNDVIMMLELTVVGVLLGVGLTTGLKLIDLMWGLF